MQARAVYRAPRPSSLRSRGAVCQTVMASTWANRHPRGVRTASNRYRSPTARYTSGIEATGTNVTIRFAWTRARSPSRSMTTLVMTWCVRSAEWFRRAFAAAASRPRAVPLPVVTTTSSHRTVPASSNRFSSSQRPRRLTRSLISVRSVRFCTWRSRLCAASSTGCGIDSHSTRGGSARRPIRADLSRPMGSARRPAVISRGGVRDQRGGAATQPPGAGGGHDDGVTPHHSPRAVSGPDLWFHDEGGALLDDPIPGALVAGPDDEHGRVHAEPTTVDDRLALERRAAGNVGADTDDIAQRGTGPEGAPAPPGRLQLQLGHLAHDGVRFADPRRRRPVGEIPGPF